MGALVFCGTGAITGMTHTSSWWAQSGKLMKSNPELLSSARGVRGFADGARWMHGAMAMIGWRMPPYRDPLRHEITGWLKYAICMIPAVAAAVVTWFFGLAWLAPVAVVGFFYAAEAQMVFLFPETLLRRKSPVASARSLTVAAGGTWAVMRGVLPIAARMLGTGWWRGRGRETWVQGCLAVVIWHRHVVTSRVRWLEDSSKLPRLEIGTTGPLLLRRESVKLGGPGRFRVLWISDLHWRGACDTGMLLALREIARQERPDLFILGGDFIERPAAFPMLKLLVKSLVRTAPCVAIPGNHDAGRFAGALREVITRAGGCWLPDAGRFELSDASGAMLEVVTAGNVPPATGVRRLVAVHDPAELDASPLSEGSLVLAGHLHGGQFVFTETAGRLLPAAWFYHHAWLRRRHRGAEWIVSRGAGDTLPLRWNCPREIILCDIS